MKKKILACCLSLLTVFSTVGCSCNGTQNTTSPRAPVTEKNEYLVTDGVLHKVSIQETDKPFITNGVSDYAIVVPTTDWGRKAGKFLKEHLEKGTKRIILTGSISTNEDLVINESTTLEIRQNPDQEEAVRLIIVSDDIHYENLPKALKILRLWDKLTAFDR